MNAQTSPAAARQIYWPSVITVISAAILIGAEVFGAAFAGGWALAILFGLDDFGAHILQAVLFALGVVIMVGLHPRRPARRAVHAARAEPSRVAASTSSHLRLILRSGLWPRLEGCRVAAHPSRRRAGYAPSG